MKHPSDKLTTMKEIKEMDTLTCDLCGDHTEEKTSKVYDLYYGEGLTHERHCDDCDLEVAV